MRPSCFRSSAATQDLEDGRADPATRACTHPLHAEREADGQRAAQVKAAAVRAALHVEQLKLRVRTEDGETRTLVECMELLKSRKSALAVESCAAR